MQLAGIPSILYWNRWGVLMDRIGAMRIFVRVVSSGSFSAVARELNTTQPTISKNISRLEKDLGVKLLRRTSREQELTEAGAVYFQRCQKILDDIDETEALVRHQTVTPQGVLRMTAPVDFSNSILAPLLKNFLLSFPDIKIDLILDNREIDLVSEGVDVAIRVGVLSDSSLFAKHAVDSHYCIVASPSYLKQFGTPQNAKELKQHNCISYSLHHDWAFVMGNANIGITTESSLRCNSGNMILESALIGMGLAALPYWLVYKHLEKGTLQQVMGDLSVVKFPISMVYLDKKYLPLKVQCFNEFFINAMERHSAFS